jgi:hypothetical protein
VKKRRRSIAVLVVVFLCLGVLVTRAFWEGGDALARGDQAHEAGDPAAAIRWWRRAARWYVPLAPHVDKAYQRMEALALAAEEKQDWRTAIAAWTGIRSSVWATRSFYTPHEDRLELANQHLKVLMARTEDPRLAQGQSREEREAYHGELLQRDPQPSVGWTVLALFGLALWIGGGALFAWRAIDREDRLIKTPALYSGAAVGIGLLLWLFGLYQA